jgi:hypothetical protein
VFLTPACCTLIYPRPINDGPDAISLLDVVERLLGFHKCKLMGHETRQTDAFRIQQRYSELVVAWTIAKATLECSLFVAQLADGIRDAQRSKASLDKRSTTLQCPHTTLDAWLCSSSIHHNIHTGVIIGLLQQLLCIQLR